jgi:selenide,water dikinase
LATLPLNQDPNLLVGTETADDAGVYRLNDDTALVLTADYITPPVDDPYLFGQVAAANALSDVYAMGGRPITALNLVGFPSDQLPLEMLERIIAGALSKIHEAGAVLAGGHSTEDEEPKFGLSVTGLVHPDRIWRNVGARPGDRLLLTKPLGSGVLFNANRKGWVSRAALDACLAHLTTLNRRAAEVLAGFTVNACTDVTGFGLAGHGFEMAKASGVTLAIGLEGLPVMDESLEMYRRGMTTGVNHSNRALVTGQLRFEREFLPWQQEILFDPQTSGGLLASLPADEAEAALAALHAGGVPAAVLVGEVLPRGEEYLRIR